MSENSDNKPPMLLLSNASVILGKQSFGPFSLSVNTAERIAILGPSGAGKSSLLKILAGELKPSRGEVLFLQRNLGSWSLPELSCHRAVLPQSNEVAFGLAVELVIGLGRVARMHDPQLHRIISDAANLACAGHLLGRSCNTLSGGEKARVQLARIFAQLWDVNNGLVLVDEPLAALDPGLQFEIMAAIENFASERHHAVVAVLHDINHAMHGFERLLLVKEGRLIGDMPSASEAIEALEALYGITLDRAISSSGELIVTPLGPRRNKGNKTSGIAA